MNERKGLCGNTGINKSSVPKKNVGVDIATTKIAPACLPSKLPADMWVSMLLAKGKDTIFGQRGKYSKSPFLVKCSSVGFFQVVHAICCFKCVMLTNACCISSRTCLHCKCKPVSNALNRILHF